MNLKELSDLLGLSQTTVSRALNGYSEVSESTRIRVTEAARKYNYRPNARATGLATGRAMTIGHVLPLASKYEVVNPIFGEFMAGASQTYNTHGYELLLKVADADDEAEIYKILAAKGAVDGVIVHSPRRGDKRIELLRDIGLPFVVHGRVSESEPVYSWIDFNNRRAFQQACKLLIDLGHQRIALINGPEELNFAWLRKQGYLQALKDASIEQDSQLISSGAMTESYGYESALAMLAMDNPPTAIMASSYIVALGVQRVIAQRGWVLGRDVSVIIHDDELSFFHNHGDVPQFTATRSSVREAGEIAAQMLMDIIQHPERQPLSRLLEARLTIGASTGPNNATDKQ
jgi:LacI family transcriptional regulator